MVERYNAYLKDLGVHQPPSLHSVVKASDYDALRFELSNALEYARQTMPPTEFAEAMALSQDSQASGGTVDG